MNIQDTNELRKSERQPYEARVEFIVDADIIRAKSIDISEDGVRLETEKAINIYMKLKTKDEEKKYFAELVWAKRKNDGGMEYGFEYIPEANKNTF